MYGKGSNFLLLISSAVCTNIQCASIDWFEVWPPLVGAEFQKIVTNAEIRLCWQLQNINSLAMLYLVPAHATNTMQFHKTSSVCQETHWIGGPPLSLGGGTSPGRPQGSSTWTSVCSHEQLTCLWSRLMLFSSSLLKVRDFWSNYWGRGHLTDHSNNISI